MGPHDFSSSVVQIYGFIHKLANITLILQIKLSGMRLKETLSQRFDSEIKNIIFDLGGVLLDIDISRTVEAFRSLNIEGLSVDDIMSCRKELFFALETGDLSPEGFVAGIRECWPASEKIAEEQIWRAWGAVLLDFDLSRFELLVRLKESYRLFLLSNTNLPHRKEYLARFARQSGGRQLESYFERCYYSDEMHLRKPDPAIFREVIRQSGLAPSQTLFIDDNADNLAGARKVGLNTLHITGEIGVTDLFE